MAGKKFAPVDVYVVFNAAMYSLNASPSLQGVYVSREAAMIAANNDPDAVQPMPLNYSGADHATNVTADGGAKAKPKTKTPKTDKEVNGEVATKTNSKKKLVPDGELHSLAGQRVATSGTLRTMDRTTFEQTVEKFDGTNVTKFADATKIVLGDKPGSKRTEEITTGGYHTMSEEEFYDTIGAVFAPPAKKAKKE